MNESAPERRRRPARNANRTRLCAEMKLSEFCNENRKSNEDIFKITEENNDQNNNIEPEENDQSKATKFSKNLKQKKVPLFRRRNTVAVPYYTPDYVTPITPSTLSKSGNRNHERKSCLQKQCSFPIEFSKEHTDLTIEKLRQKYSRTIYEPKVPVREKVALMESWGQKTAEEKARQPPKRSNSNSSTRQQGSPEQKKVQQGSPEQKKVQFRSQTRVLDNNNTTTPVACSINPRRVFRDSKKHRRSMSDPNLQKSFQAMKQLWDKKVEQDSKPQLPSSKPNKTRGTSESSSNSGDFDRSLRGRERGGSVKIVPVHEEKRIGPPTPTKPKQTSQLKLSDDDNGDVRKKTYSNADLSVGNLVKNRAKMFDSSSSTESKPSVESNRTSLNRGKNRSATVDSTSDETNSIRGRMSGLENAKKERTSPRHSANNNKKSDEPRSELARLLDHDESNDKDNNEDFLMSGMRRNSANLAKERRRNTRRSSKESDSDSSSVASSLSSTSVEGPLVTRRSAPKEDSVPENSNNTSPVISSFLHRTGPPKSVPCSPSIPPVKPPRRKGSLGSFERRDSDNSISSSGSFSLLTPSPPRRQSSLHKDHSSPIISHELDMISPTAALHRKLSIDAAKRASMSTDSGTGTISPGLKRQSRSSTKSSGNRDSIISESDSFVRGGSLSRKSKTPPAPPPSSKKPGRPRSASASPMSHQQLQPARPNVPPPPPPPPTVLKRFVSPYVDTSPDSTNRDSIISTTTISSRLSQISGLSEGNFNAEDEYNRILDVIAAPTTTMRFRTESSVFQDEKKIEETKEELQIQPPTTLDISLSIKPTETNRDSLEVPSRKSGNSDNESWSDFDPSDADEEGNQTALTPSAENQNSGELTPVNVPIEVKIHNIAKELLSTESTYVDVLNLIDQIFHKRVLEAINKKQISSDVKNIFSNVSAIYQFHSEFLLPQLQARLKCWDTNPKLGDILTQAAPFLKMYSLYVQNFDEAMNMVKHWSEKSNNFANIIKLTQAMPECGSLSLQHHMLGPVQRIPRYKMLLEDYLKRLPEDALDRPDAETALTLISQAATHSNETMKQSDKFHKLLHVYNNLVDINFDMVDVSRELLLEGKIIKISARNGEKHERYLYLFNDMLLCCTPLRRLQRKSYKITAKIDLDGMEVNDVTNMTIPNTFCVNGTKKSMEFAANSPDQKEKWLNAINDAIDSFLERKTSFMKSGSQKRKVKNATDELPPGSPLRDIEQQQLTPLSPLHSPSIRPISFEEVETNEEKRIEITCTLGAQYVEDIEDHDLGKRAPRWIKDNEVTMCMNCSKAFNKFLRRRHHCRACGRVICTECSEHKYQLQYDSGKSHKVCNKCYAILTGRKNTDGADKKGVLEIEADTVSVDSVISEYLYFAESDKKKTWTKMWCVIPKNEPCLYVYGANQDVRATMTMPLPGFTVEETTTDRDFSFKLVQARKTLYFAASSKDQKSRWENAFRKAGRGEDVPREGVHKSTSDDDQLKEDLQEEMILRLATTNGSRLSSSSAESANTSSTSNSDSSRPSSTMEKNNSFNDVNDVCANNNSSRIYSELVT